MFDKPSDWWPWNIDIFFNEVSIKRLICVRVWLERLKRVKETRNVYAAIGLHRENKYNNWKYFSLSFVCSDRSDLQLNWNCWKTWSETWCEIWRIHTVTITTIFNRNLMFATEISQIFVVLHQMYDEQIWNCW